MLNNERHEIRPETIKLPIRSYGGHSGITAAMEHEFIDIEFAMEDAVCKLSEGDPAGNLRLEDENRLRPIHQTSAD